MSSSLILLKLLHQKEFGGTQIGGRGHSLTPTEPSDTPEQMAARSAHRAQGRRKKRVSDGVCLPQSPLHEKEPRFSRDGCTLACPWEQVNGFLTLLFLSVWCLLYLFNHFYLNLCVFSLSLFGLSPPFQQQDVSG